MFLYKVTECTDFLMMVAQGSKRVGAINILM
jgi:hypothetical protein